MQVLQMIIDHQESIQKHCWMKGWTIKKCLEGRDQLFCDGSTENHSDGKGCQKLLKVA